MPGNMNNLMKQAQRMQRQMEEKQKEMEDKVWEASAGGGAVTVRVSGKKEIESVTLSPEVVDPDDIEMLEDFITIAFNEAVNNAIKTAEEEMAASNEPTLLSSLDELNIRTITECCDKGDRVAIDTFRRVGTMLGIGLANYASVINPEAIILTGDMMVAGKWLLKPMRAAFDEHVFHNIRGKVRILAGVSDQADTARITGSSGGCRYCKPGSYFFIFRKL